MGGHDHDHEGHSHGPVSVSSSGHGHSHNAFDAHAHSHSHGHHDVSISSKWDCGTILTHQNEALRTATAITHPMAIPMTIMTHMGMGTIMTIM